MNETHEVKLLRGDQVEHWLLEFDQTHGTKLRLLTDSGEEHYSSSAADLFDCLSVLRLEHLEPLGLRIQCNGARQDVYPSRMSRQMSNGRKAYTLRLGAPARREDIVDIFEPAPEKSPLATVAEQRTFYKRWLASLG